MPTIKGRYIGKLKINVIVYHYNSKYRFLYSEVPCTSFEMKIQRTYVISPIGQSFWNSYKLTKCVNKFSPAPGTIFEA